MPVSRHGFGLHLGGFLSRGIHWRTGRSDTDGGEPEDLIDRDAEPTNAAGDDDGGLEYAPPDELEADELEADEDERPRAAAEPEPAPATAQAELASVAARESAVGVYCRELCGPGAAGSAGEEVFASPRLSGPFTVVPEDELCRVTRATASGFAPLLIDFDGTIDAPQPPCTFTIPRLARRANGELDRYSQAALKEHLAGCVVCRAAEARFDRAERAFAMVLGLAGSAIESPPAEVEAEEAAEVEPPVAEPPAAAIAAIAVEPAATDEWAVETEE